MKQTWRWFGPADTIDVADLPQVGVQGIVSALHHIAPGRVWPLAEIQKRQAEIAGGEGRQSGLEWSVVESLPVSEVIKTKGAAYRDHIAAYCDSLTQLAAAGLSTICYNFMPILDWTRTDLGAVMDHGGRAMKFDLVDFIVFDVFILARPGAADEFAPDLVAAAKARFGAMSDGQKRALQNNIVAGLPGANDNWSLDQVRELLGTYAGFSRDQLRQNLVDFLAEIMPTAERLGMKMCCHPDDPPFSLLGLPRVMSNEADYTAVMNAVDSPSSGITYCTGSLGVAADFDAVGFIERLGHRIHFAHLRNTTRLVPADGPMTSFYEAAHLEGDTDMVSVVRALMGEERKRKAAGRADWEIPMRPDHGQDLLHDLTAGGMPGYPLIGRMRGLAELRGIMAAS